MRIGGMISLVNAREVISTSGKEIILLVKRLLASGKERRSKTNWKRIYSGRLGREATQIGATQTRSYSDTKLSRIANLHDSSANLSQSRIKSEAELNHYGDVRTSHTINQSNSKYFEV